MMEVFDTKLFHAKVINNEAELDGSPFVAPETRSGSRFVVTFGLEAGVKEIVGQDACLGKTITSLANFKVDPTITILTGEVVFFNELCRYVRDLDADVFRVGHGSVKVKILQVDGAELCTLPGEDTVEEKFDEFKGGGVGANVARVANPVATNGDMGVVRVNLLRANFADHHGMTDLLALVEGDVLEVDEEEGISTRYPLTGWRRSRTNALAEPT